MNDLSVPRLNWMVDIAEKRLVHEISLELEVPVCGL